MSIYAQLSADRKSVVGKKEIDPEFFAKLSEQKREGYRLWEEGEKPKAEEGKVVVEAGVEVGKTKAKQSWKMVDKPKDRAGDSLLGAFDRGEATPHETQRAIAWLLRQARPEK